MELTGEIADGVVLNYLVSPEYNQQAIEALQIGARTAGRTLADIDRPQLVVCSVHEDRQTALDMARLMVTQYLGQQPHIMKASGVPQSAARPRRRGADVAGDARAGRRGVEAGARRDRPDAHGVGHAGRGPRTGVATTCATAAPARSCTRSAMSTPPSTLSPTGPPRPDSAPRAGERAVGTGGTEIAPDQVSRARREHRRYRNRARPGFTGAP